jgi:hypothetical protein
MDPRISVSSASVNGMTMSYLECGTGPLALCLHGFPDSAHTWRHLLPALADAGFRAVAPFTRGYAPTSVAPDGLYQTGALSDDANVLHDVLGADENAVIIGQHRVHTVPLLINRRVGRKSWEWQCPLERQWAWHLCPTSTN